MSDEQRPQRPPRQPGPWRPGVKRPGPHGRPAYPGGGPRPWASRRTIPTRGIGLIAEGEEIIAGRRPVEEAFVARRDLVKLLVVPQRRDALQQIVLHATAVRIPIIEVEGAVIGQLAGFDGHQGVALVVRRRPDAAPEEILARAVARGEAPFIVALDGVEDPQNFGSMIRSAEAVGVHGIMIGSTGAAPLSPAAIKASAGAVEHLLVARVDNLADELTALRLRGIRVVGAEAEAAQTYREADLRGPICLVIGAEGKGLSPAVRRRIDLFVRIPMAGRVASLNAAVAGSVLLFEILGQRPAPVNVARSVPSPELAMSAAEPVDAAPEVVADAGDEPLPGLGG